MGSGASKSARRLPTTTPSALHPHPTPSPIPPPASPSAVLRDPLVSERPPASAGEVGGSDATPDYGRRMEQAGAAPVTGRARPGFSGEKDAAVMKDGMDPQFASNLSRLGPVAIHDAGKFVRTPAPAQRTLTARQKAYTPPSSMPAKGQLSTTDLITLLDSLKKLPPGADPGPLYRHYGVDTGTMRELRRWVNSPSVADEVVTVVGGEERKTLPAVWVDAADMAGSPRL